VNKELWEGGRTDYTKGGVRLKRKRVTKGQLVREYYEKGGNQMPKIDTEVREGADTVDEGKVYEITNVEDIQTDVQQFSGIRVTLLSAKAEGGNVVLWKRPVTGKGSKLGVFITVLGANTDKWLHKWIKFVTWQPRNRVIEVVAAPAPSTRKKAPKKAT